jgi:hypothetical protein
MPAGPPRPPARRWRGARCCSLAPGADTHARPHVRRGAGGRRRTLVRRSLRRHGARDGLRRVGWRCSGRARRRLRCARADPCLAGPQRGAAPPTGAHAAAARATRTTPVSTDGLLASRTAAHPGPHCARDPRHGALVCGVSSPAGAPRCAARPHPCAAPRHAASARPPDRSRPPSAAQDGDYIRPLHDDAVANGDGARVAGCAPLTACPPHRRHHPVGQAGRALQQRADAAQCKRKVPRVSCPAPHARVPATDRARTARWRSAWLSGARARASATCECRRSPGHRALFACSSADGPSSPASSFVTFGPYFKSYSECACGAAASPSRLGAECRHTRARTDVNNHSAALSLLKK